jgi:hypothetical protein
MCGTSHGSPRRRHARATSTGTRDPGDPSASPGTRVPVKDLAPVDRRRPSIRRVHLAGRAATRGAGRHSRAPRTYRRA